MESDSIQSVFLVHSSDAEGQDFGTAFIIHKSGATFFLTCAHVVTDVGIRKARIDGKPARLITKLDPNHNTLDLAVLRVDDLFEQPALPLSVTDRSEVRFEIPGCRRLDQRKRMISPIEAKLGKRTHVTDGPVRVPAREMIIEDEDVLERGYSGSPVIESSTGRVMGVMSARFGAGNKGIAISIRALSDIWPDMPARLREYHTLNEKETASINAAEDDERNPWDNDDPELVPHIREYCEKAAAFHKTLPLAGFKTRLRVPIRVEDIYIPLQAMVDLRGTGRASFADSEDAEKRLNKHGGGMEISIPEAFRTGRLNRPGIARIFSKCISGR